jgi:hypothetical protein
MIDLPPPPDLDAALDLPPEIKSFGQPENAPADKELDELAQLPATIQEQLPDETHPSLSPRLNPLASASTEDFPQTPVMPVRKDLDRRLLDPHNAIGKENVWPGIDGLPFRGQIRDIKEDDEIQPKRGVQAHVEILVLNDPEHLKRYTEIMQVIANGLGALGTEKEVYDNDIKSWRIFIRWWELYTFLPKTKGR